MTRRRLIQVLAIAALAVAGIVVVFAPTALHANGGTLRVNNVEVGPYRMSVFTDPTPMRPGPVDVSVLVLDPSTGEVVWGLSVGVEATDGANALWRPATREQADDPERYYSAKFDLPAPGDWVFTVQVDVMQDGEVSHSTTAQFEVAVREAGLLGNPFIVIGLLLLPLLGLAGWILRAPQAPAGAGQRAVALAWAVVLSTAAACTPPSRTPPYEALAEVFAVEDERRAALPEELVAATKVQNPLVRSAAYRALGRHERVDWIPTIAAGLRDPDPEVRVVAINATAQAAFQDGPELSGKREALDIFTAALGGERHPRVRAAIALAAGRLGADSALGAVAERIILEVSTEPGEAALFDPRSIATPGAPLLDLVRGSAALARASQGMYPAEDALVILLAELTAFGRSGSPVTVLDPNEPSLTAARIRRSSLTALLSIGRLSAPVVTEAALDVDPGVRAILAVALNSDPPLPAGDVAMASLADDPSPQVRVRWIAAYARGDRPEGCAPLVAATRDVDTLVRLAAIRGLAGPCPDAAESQPRQRLAQIADELDGGSGAQWHAPAQAVLALAELDSPAAPTYAEALAVHPSPFARAWAARAYAVLGDADALRRLASDDVANVRTAALPGLERLLGPRAVPILVAQLGQADPQLVMTAARLLEGHNSTPTAREALLSASSRFTSRGRETDRDARMALLERIAELGQIADSSALLAMAEDYDPAIASRATEIASTWVGRTVAAAPRPFDTDPTPSAEELERLDGAHVELEMETGGSIRIELFPLLAPTNAARIARLADSGVLDGLTLHRVVPGFVIQGGSPGANEYNGHGAFSRDEISDRAHWRGTVGLSTRGRDTGDGQIFVNLLDNLRLDNNYTIYGQVVGGMDGVDNVVEGARITRATLIPASD